MAKKIRIAGTHFNINFFKSYIKNIFGESFTFSSLSFEQAFNETKKANALLTEFASPKNSEYAFKLEKGSEEERRLLLQRRDEVRNALIYFGLPSEKMPIEEYPGEETPCVDDYEQFFQGAIRPYRNTRELQEAREQELLTGKPYEEETLVSKCGELFKLINQKLLAERQARSLKKANNDAFLYALSCPIINVPTILEINSLVNNGMYKKGFKTSNNDILSANWSTCPKELVGTRMAELIWKYNNEWFDEIPELIPEEEAESHEAWEELKEKHLKAICLREAKFHIEFEHIHPFEDGNGRTGRIILNRNLIANELAPILITPQMRETYINYLNNSRYEDLARMIYELSSIELTQMISAYRRARGINPDELALQEFPKKVLKFKDNKKKQN